MSNFKAKMNQIRYPLALRPRPTGKAYSASDSPAYHRGLLLRGGRERRRTEGKGKEGREGVSVA